MTQPSLFRLGGFPLPLLVLATLILVGCGNDNGQQGGGMGEMPPPPVTYEQVRTQDVAVEQDYAGRARGAREVEVRARIQGILEQRLYNEGQMVSQDDVLFQIDRKPAEAEVQRAQAQKKVAEADLQQAQREWNRVSSLFQRGAVSERERDTAQSALEMARASLAVAEAGLAQAELNLSYTDVRAPVSGTTSLEAVPEGSLVQQGTLLTTIVQQDPIHVRFGLPENDARIHRTARQAAMGESEASTFSATLILTDGSEYDLPGEVDFTASIIDARTGSVSARAVFPNPDYRVVPGQFVRVRLLLQSLEQVITVPERAVLQGPMGPMLMLVDDEGKSAVRPVELGPVVDGRQVILSGLQDGERVIFNGLAGLRPGIPVQAKNVAEQEGR